MKYTFCGINKNCSLIDYFMLSENISSRITQYYTTDSIDNLSDHVPLFLVFQCIISNCYVSSTNTCSNTKRAVWGIITDNDIISYKTTLDKLLYHIYPPYENLIYDMNTNVHVC